MGTAAHGVVAYLPGTLLAAVAAVLFAVGSVLQHDAATAVAREGALPFGRLVRRPAWLLGQGALVAAAGVQVAALALAPVAIVQPMLAAGLVVALGLRAFHDRTMPSGTDLLGAALTVGGLAVFLVAARPATGAPERGPSLVAVLGVVAIGVAAVAAASRVRRGVIGAVVCGAAGGLAAGIAAVLIAAALKVFSQHGVLAALAAPELWAAIAMAVVAQVGAQLAFGQGVLAWSLPALTVIDPLAAVPAARVLLGEHLEPGHAAVWLPAALVSAVGVVLLARSEEVSGHPAEPDRPASD